ncbi:AB hydrolase superfamily protein YvaM [Oceanibacterium hippocampi]|uniref:AB hydrolase superfamily protein YvaM n=2 Tax=Oceanibacterium hippocampi TaxID=745714 RepID=A0A1Y5SH48_9PROT|nr:AB hydrolase superfamily protein YvaM [Oceanibacterium hippocampi]
MGVAMSDFPEIRYANSDGLSIAYQVWGEGSRNLVLVPGIFSHLEAFLEMSEYADWMRALSSFCRVITFDKRGNGMSDRIVGAPTVDERVMDIQAVMDAAGVSSAVLAGFSEGSALALVFAAREPVRITKLIICGGFPAGELVLGTLTEEDRVKIRRRLLENWGKPGGRHAIARFGPGPEDPAGQEIFAHVCRLAATPTTIAALYDLQMRFDVRKVLPFIRQPTLVLRRAEEPITRAMSKSIADAVPNGIYRELPGSAHVPFFGDQEDYIDAIRDFVLGEDAGETPVPGRRVLASVLFTDLVNSTGQQARLGDNVFRELISRHDALARRLVERHKGRFIHSTGDGLLATFDTPSNAIACAVALRDRLAGGELRMRAGVHTGEIELRGDDISGLSVNIASRIADLAGEGEIVTSDLTRQLMIGSRVIFEARGVVSLKGVPGEWPLYTALSTQAPPSRS